MMKIYKVNQLCTPTDRPSCVGYFTNLKQAKYCVVNNITDLCEDNFYKYVSIEVYNSGLSYCVWDKKYLYKYNLKTHKYNLVNITTESFEEQLNMVDLTKYKNQVIILAHGNYYGCIKDNNGNIIKKGFATHEEARQWINDKVVYESRWTE